jgi:hypothetical protein
MKTILILACGGLIAPEPVTSQAPLGEAGIDAVVADAMPAVSVPAPGIGNE